MNKRDREPAFPSYGNMWKGMEQGMSLRDWFAGMALQGMLVNGFIPHIARPKSFDPVQMDTWNYATVAYNMADFMLAEREENVERRK